MPIPCPPELRTRAVYQRRRRGVLLLVALALACGAGDPDAGAPGGAQEPPAPRRIACWGAELCDLLVELGLGPRIVGADAASLARPELSHATGLGEDLPSAEVLHALRPDLVLVLASETLVEAAGEMPVHHLAPSDVNEVLWSVQRIGDLTGASLRARTVTARMTREVAEIAVRRDGLSRLRVAWLIGRDPWVAVGGAGLLHQVLELAGGENAFHDPPQPRRVVSVQEIEATPHDVVLGRDVPVDPALSTLPALDLAGRVRALHRILYPPEPEDPAPRGPTRSDQSTGPPLPGR